MKFDALEIRMNRIGRRASERKFRSGRKEEAIARIGTELRFTTDYTFSKSVAKAGGKWRTIRRA